MGFPRKLKQMALFLNGRWMDENVSVTLPKLTRKFEEWRGGGMDRPVKIDMGGEALECEWVCGGWVRDVIRQFGHFSMAGIQLRFVGSFQNDDTGGITRVEITVRGRHEEIDRGESKPGDDTELKVKTACVFYQETWNGVEEAYIDVLGGIERFGGVDRMLPHRQALGLA